MKFCKNLKAQIIVATLLFTASFFSSVSANAALNRKANIVILATGGTIAGAGKSSNNAQYSPSQLMVDQIIANVPDVNKIANITGIQFSQISSQNMNNEIWLKLAKTVNQIASKRNVDGIVITHGTDTLEETAYFLNLVAKTKKPIILVGSMRPSTSLSADGSLNLFNAISLAANPEAKNKGVMVVFNDNIFAARDVAKTHATNVDTFQAPNSGAIGHIYYGKAQFYYIPTRLHTTNSIFDVRNLEELPKVDIVYGYANQSKSTVEDLLENKAKGIVYAGVGDGNIYQDSFPVLTDAIKNGTIVVRSSRNGSGFVVPNAEINDDEYKFVTADNLNPQKARILLMLALTKSKDPKQIQKWFWQY